MKKVLSLLGLATITFNVNAATTSDCYKSSINVPTPFLGNTDELLELSDGSTWKVGIGEYNYLYQYYPSVTACPTAQTITLNVSNKDKVIKAKRTTNPVTAAVTPSTVSSIATCDNSTIKGDYIMQWQGVDGEKSITGTVSVYFDGSTDKSGFGKFSLGGYASNYRPEKLPYPEIFDSSDSSYSVIDGMCNVTFGVSFPDKSFTLVTIYLDDLITTTKPYKANHGFGMAYIGTVPVSVTMSRWIKQK